MTVKKLIVIGMALCAVGCSKGETQAPAETNLPPSEIGKLGASGFALFQCAAYASFANMDKSKVEPLFNRGHDNLTRFIDLGKKVQGKEMDKAVSSGVPILVLQHLGGPSTEFMVGRVWEATSLYVEDELYQREGWTHQKKDPKAPSPTKELVEADAAQHFRDQNCELL